MTITSYRVINGRLCGLSAFGTVLWQSILVADGNLQTRTDVNRVCSEHRLGGENAWVMQWQDNGYPRGYDRVTIIVPDPSVPEFCRTLGQFIVRDNRHDPRI